MGDPLERHHIFGGPYRRKSEKYGLTVYLCGKRCHREGPDAVHKNAETSEKLKAAAQKKVMKEQEWDVERFIMEFGRNYL